MIFKKITELSTDLVFTNSNNKFKDIYIVITIFIEQTQKNALRRFKIVLPLPQNQLYKGKITDQADFVPIPFVRLSFWAVSF